MDPSINFAQNGNTGNTMYTPPPPAVPAQPFFFNPQLQGALDTQVMYTPPPPDYNPAHPQYTPPFLFNNGIAPQDQPIADDQPEDFVFPFQDVDVLPFQDDVDLPPPLPPRDVDLPPPIPPRDVDLPPPLPPRDVDFPSMSLQNPDQFEFVPPPPPPPKPEYIFECGTPFFFDPEPGPKLDQPKPLKPRGKEVKESCAQPHRLVKNFLDQDSKVTNLYQANPHDRVGCMALSLTFFTASAITFGVGLGLTMGGLWVVGAPLLVVSALSATLGTVFLVITVLPHKDNKITQLIQNDKCLTPAQKRMLRCQGLCNKRSNVLQMQMLALHIKHDQNLSDNDRIRLLNRFAGKRICPADVATLRREYQRARTKKVEEPHTPIPTPTPTPISQAKPRNKPEAIVEDTNPLLTELKARLKEREARLARNPQVVA